jgi:hypothetical protein
MVMLTLGDTGDRQVQPVSLCLSRSDLPSELSRCLASTDANGLNQLIENRILVVLLNHAG